jgi:electron transfer flavoprotein alpha subunit
MILAILEHDKGKLSKAARCVLTAAKKVKSLHGGEKLVGLVLGGSAAADVAKEAATCGLDAVHYCSDKDLERYLSINFAKAVSASITQIGTPSVMLISSSAIGKDLAPRVCYELKAGLASDIIDVLPNGLFKRLMYAGNVVAEVEITTAVKAATVRASAFEPTASGDAACSVSPISLSGFADDRNTFVSFDTVASERPELSGADIVVSGGRAVKSKEGFEQLIFTLADSLGAAVGASRAAVDSGYAPNDWQVGQTGKIVAPNLYIAVGISGAIQHIAGMKDSKVIVAINKDPEAPIMEVADYGLVADIFEAVPQLIEEIKKVRGA